MRKLSRSTIIIVIAIVGSSAWLQHTVATGNAQMALLWAEQNENWQRDIECILRQSEAMLATIGTDQFEHYLKTDFTLDCTSVIDRK
ncbi:hypothetical protein LRP52_28965 [Photobacterium sp. ZSDE20]|uniref:Uncharacterized protein n=1 Tax=Photobacterium pectinilyticum TaxID=2906793 RepID=A0ABT1N6T6_9GAMM|nr:hypothetical protein [Photobacterium sp. ZSDE20]MCQ1060463.1 hypothetical protein [Photobacterium sp. ZSDE20]MDD1826213.1 hypothetical protein [Photobacterium sp. ZSDE20]